MTATMTSTNLGTMSLLSIFFICRREKQESNFQKVGGLVTKYFFYRASCALLQRNTEFNTHL